MGTLDYRALAVLDAVVSQGSFEKAAAALGISQSAVSQRIKALEDASGRLLIVRGAPAVPTGLGQRLVTHHRNVRLMEAALDIDLGNKVSMPEIAIAVDAASLATWFPLCLPPLLSPPRCQLAVHGADRAQALHLVHEGSVFGAVVASLPGVPDGHAPAAAAAAAAAAGAGPRVTALGTLRHVCVATPAFAGHWFGEGVSGDAVQLAPAIVSERELMTRWLADAAGIRGGFPHHTLPSPSALADAIMRGLAYGVLPQALAADALLDGRLVELAPGSAVDVALHWHAWDLDTPFTRALDEQVIRTARQHCLQISSS